MNSDKIMNADLLDILFDGKNKEYGAYELRKTYNHRITLAVVSMATVCLLFFLSQILANDKDIDRNIPVTDVTIDPLNEPKKETPITPPVQPPKAEIEKIKVIKDTPPLIVEDEKVTDPPPLVSELDHAQIGLANTDGAEYNGFTAPPPEVSTGTAEIMKKPVEDYEKLFIRVEKEAQFPGGMEAWKRYLERNLNANVAADDGAAIGNYTVKVQFIVDKEGGISNVQAIEVPPACPGCGPEAVKVIKKGPKWEPAIQNGRNVIYQAVQFITFQVAE